MERANDEEEHAHYIEVAIEIICERDLDFGLNFVSDNVFGEKEFDEDVEERDDSEDEEEEENVVAVEEVIGFGGGVIEPEGFGGGE